MRRRKTPPSCDGKSDGFQIDRGRLAVLPLLELIRDLLVLAQASESGAFDRRNVHEHVLRFVVGLNEAEPLGAVEELYGTDRHQIIRGRKAAPRGILLTDPNRIRCR